jgi:hypothetical protein
MSDRQEPSTFQSSSSYSHNRPKSGGNHGRNRGWHCKEQKVPSRSQDLRKPQTLSMGSARRGIPKFGYCAHRVAPTTSTNPDSPDSPNDLGCNHPPPSRKGNQDQGAESIVVLCIH